MTTPGDKSYFRSIGHEGVAHSLNKPFSETDRGAYLARFAAVLGQLPPTPSKLLDLGCGTGWTSVFFARSGYEVTGQDISPEAIEHARSYAQRHGVDVRFMLSDFESLGYGQTYDCAVFFDALHHATDEQAALRSVYRILRPGGVCVLCEPGAGHSRSPEAQRAVYDYGVTEKDMSPRYVMGLAREIGFARIVMHPDPEWIYRFTYVPKSGSGTKWRGARWLRWPSLAGVYTILRYRKGLVVLEK